MLNWPGTRIVPKLTTGDKLKTIFQAAQDDDLETLKSLLATDQALANSLEPETGWTPLQCAAKHNAVASIRLLRQHGAQFSENYQVLKQAQQTRHWVSLTYKQTRRTIRVIQIGYTEGLERCFAWQQEGTPDHPEPGLRCFRVQALSEVELTDPIGVSASMDLTRARPCVALVDKDF